MKEEIGLKGIYRFLGKLIARLLNKSLKPFNPNIITVCGFLIYIIAVAIFTIYGEKAKYDINLFIFVIGAQLALISDFADGSYARMINKTTHFGHVLDSFLGGLRFIILLAVAYFIAKTPSEKYIVVFLTLIYALNQKVKFALSPQNNSNLTNRGNDSYAKSKRKISYLVKIPFGFGTAHFYLYVTLWFLFDFVYFLFVLYFVGLFSIVTRTRLLSREDSEKG
ncbi:hypothetical protein ES707_01822 [subsurface metagenome]